MASKEHRKAICLYILFSAPYYTVCAYIHVMPYPPPPCSDVNGLGYILSINMMPKVFVHESLLGDRLSSYGLNLTILVTVVSSATLNSDIFIRYTQL